METKKLVAMLEECQKELKDAGAYGIYMFGDGKRHGADIAVHTDNEHLPSGKAVYDTSVYEDYVIKNVAVGGVAFFALLDLEEAYKEGVTDYWGVLN